MQNILSDQSRILLGLKPVLSTWQIIQEEDRIYFFEDNILYKAIYAFEDNGDDLIVEYDTNIQLDDEQNMVSKRGKVKPLHKGNIEKEKAKEPWLTINLTKKCVLIECGVKWLPELSFTDIKTIDNDLVSCINSQYGEENWRKRVGELLKNPKTRQSYKEGDVFCIRLGAKQYVYALLIGSFMKLRKKDYWPSRETGHLFSHLMCVPIMLRKYNLISERNDLTLEEIAKYELLNPEIIMDDLLLRGDFKIVAHKKLCEDDILMPMHYSFYGKHRSGGQATAAGIGLWENRDNARDLIERNMPYYKNIYIVFNWGLGAVERNAEQWIENENSDDQFIDRCAIGGRVAGTDNNGMLINPGSIFSNEKLRSIFNTMHIECELDFDSFNKKYGGLTRTEYLKSIQ